MSILSVMDPTKVDKTESKRTKPNFNQEMQEAEETKAMGSAI